MRAMPTRRILLKTTAKLAASSAFALNRATLARANLLRDAAAGTLPEVDVALRTAVSAEDVPGVVAMAATEAGVVRDNRGTTSLRFRRTLERRVPFFAAVAEPRRVIVDHRGTQRLGRRVGAFHHQGGVPGDRQCRLRADLPDRWRSAWCSAHS
jgi:hypothetical protein